MFHKIHLPHGSTSEFFFVHVQTLASNPLDSHRAADDADVSAVLVEDAKNIFVKDRSLAVDEEQKQIEKQEKKREEKGEEEIIEQREGREEREANCSKDRVSGNSYYKKELEAGRDKETGHHPKDHIDTM